MRGDIRTRKYGLALIMTKLKQTSETAIALKFLAMNLERRLRVLLVLFGKWAFSAIGAKVIHSFGDLA